MIQRRGPQLPGQKIDALIELLGHSLCTTGLLVQGGIPVSFRPHRLEAHTECGHLLSELVVNVSSNTTPLLLLYRDQSCEQRVDLRGPFTNALLKLLIELAQTLFALAQRAFGA